MDSRQISRSLAESSIVLLKNEANLLPLKPQTKVAIFGRTQEDTVFSGNGSGASHADGGLSILTACEQAGLIPEPELAEYYRTQVAAGIGCQETFDWSQAGQFVNSGLMYEIFGKYREPAQEYVLKESQLEKARAFSDTAILVLGRNAGSEECDRHLADDYYLSELEKKLIHDVTSRFEKVILVLNVNGVLDLGWTEKCPQIKSILFIGIPGEQGMPALADILTGKVPPSGKLSFTIAKQYEDYPSARDFTWDKHNQAGILDYASYGLDAKENGSKGFAISPVTVYREDIYLGYRYFDTFGVEPLFPFGYGLSYTGFAWESISVRRTDGGISLTVRMKNTGTYPGREVIQIYACGDCELPWPAQKLAAFGKTKLLEPGETEELTLIVSWKELALYNEASAAWEISKGTYLLRVGTSSRCNKETVQIRVPETLPISQCANRLRIQPCNRGKLDFLTAPKVEHSPWSAPWEITLDTITSRPHEANKPDFPEVENLTDEELAALCVGYGPGIPFSAFLNEELPNTLLRDDGTEIAVNNHPTGFNGYISPAMPEKGIHSVFYKDGPAGIGETAWPTQMLMACAFDPDLWLNFGRCIAQECEKQQVDIWLAPAVNLLRHPLGGRSFEYFSEDPYLTGMAAVSVAKGVQESGKVLVCPKHFAANEQETFRRGNTKRNIDAVDSIVTERALREMYLKPFQMLVEDAPVHCIMTSFNKINGTFAAGSRDLCTHILREEWGFHGVVVTDWGDMDTVVDGADAVAAGNDVVMPGGPPVIWQILEGLEKGTVSRQNLILAVKHLLIIAKNKKYKKEKST